MGRFFPTPFVAPTWGESIGRGVNSAFDSIMNAMIAREARDKGRVDQFMQTGQDPNRIQRGMAISDRMDAAGPGAGASLTPEDAGVFGEYLDFQEQMRGMARMKREGLEAETDYKRAQAEALRNGWGGDQDLNVVTHPGTGLQFMAQRSRNGLRYTPLPSQAQTLDEKQRGVLVAEGVRYVNELRNLMRMPGGYEAVRKAGGSWRKFLSAGDPIAQKMGFAIQKIGDARARPMTGAAINAPEEDRYFNNLLSVTGSPEVWDYTLAGEERYFRDLINAYGQGRAHNAGADVLQRDQKALQRPQPIAQDSTIALTGEKGARLAELRKKKAALAAPKKSFDARYAELQAVGLPENEIFQRMEAEGY